MKKSGYWVLLVGAVMVATGCSDNSSNAVAQVGAPEPVAPTPQEPVPPPPLDCDPLTPSY